MENLKIKGFQKTSLVDYPGKIVTTIFLPTCSFNCGFCYNPDLVINHKDMDDVHHSVIFKHLKSKKGMLDGVCITGGEPTLHKDELISFISELKKHNFLVKLDTNGSRPEIIKLLIERQLIDYIAMDIKAPIKKYNEVTRVPVNKEALQKSINLLQNGKVDYEFRTTVIPSFFKKEDALQIGKWLKGSKKFVLQQFKPDVPLLDQKLADVKPYPPVVLHDFKKMLEPYFRMVEIRN